MHSVSDKSSNVMVSALCEVRYINDALFTKSQMHSPYQLCNVPVEEIEIDGNIRTKFS